MSLVRWTHMGNRLSVSIDTDRSDMIHYVESVNSCNYYYPGSYGIILGMYCIYIYLYGMLLDKGFEKTLKKEGKISENLQVASRSFVRCWNVIQ